MNLNAMNNEYLAKEYEFIVRRMLYNNKNEKVWKAFKILTVLNNRYLDENNIEMILTMNDFDGNEWQENIYTELDHNCMKFTNEDLIKFYEILKKEISYEQG